MIYSKYNGPNLKNILLTILLSEKNLKYLCDFKLFSPGTTVNDINH